MLFIVSNHFHGKCLKNTCPEEGIMFMDMVEFQYILLNIVVSNLKGLMVLIQNIYVYINIKLTMNGPNVYFKPSKKQTWFDSYVELN